MSTKPVVTRFAPSPTGYLHAGNYRTAVFAYLFARQNGGKFILRIEDTDRARFDMKYQENIMESLAWLGLEHDELHVQSSRHERHLELMTQLIDNGSAYVSTELAKDGSGVTKEVVRFRNPGTVVTFTDLIRGEITVDTSDLGDFVIGRSINEPLFHFAVVADDMDMGVTHVVRGDDHTSNTPRQILILRALGGEDFAYAHLPMVFGTDKQKLSKRRGARALTDYRDMGYLPEAVLNFMALLGWNPGEGTEQELFTKDELVSQFRLDRVHKSPAIFNQEKLDWFNRQYILKLPFALACEGMKKYLNGYSWFNSEVFERVAPVLLERISYFGAVGELAQAGEVEYFFATPSVSAELVSAKNTHIGEAVSHLQAVLGLLDFDTLLPSADEVKVRIMPYANEHGRAQVLWPLRVALCGREKSPDPFTLVSVLGVSESVARVARAIAVLGGV